MKYLFYLISIIFFCNCNNSDNKNTKIQEDYKNGKINISVDESYKPIIEEILKVFSSSYPNAKINVLFKTEAKCLKDLYNDSIRLVITSKKISVEEQQSISDKIGFNVSSGILAYDAVAVITNIKCSDSIFSINEIKDILLNKNKKYTPIVDGLDQSSVLRYITEYIIKENINLKNIKGSKNSNELLNNVYNNKNLIGFIGVSWVGNNQDSFQLSFNNKIRISSIECLNCEKKNIFVKPYQANLISNKYPFLREVNYILKENFMGVGRGFVNFMNNERGQLIFKRAYLVPSKMNFNIRNVKIKS